jgi:hypothetical protein
MAKVYRGWIEGNFEDAEALISIGVKLGAWDEKLRTWSSCEVTPEILEKMDSFWGKFIWGLDPVEVCR